MSQDLASHRGAGTWLFLRARRFFGHVSAKVSEREGLVRRSIPLLVLLFIVSLGGSVFLHLYQERQETLREASLDLRLAAQSIVQQSLPRLGQKDATRVYDDIIAQARHEWGERRVSRQRVILVLDQQGTVKASSLPELYPIDAELVSLIEATGPIVQFAERAGVLTVTDPRSQTLLIYGHSLPGEAGLVVEIQAAAHVLSRWRRQAITDVTVYVITSFVVLLMGFAFHWQAVRAREADLISDRTRARLDLALDRGRCGLWDCDLRRGRVYWSPSMFDILGRKPKTDALSYHDIATLLHQDDRGFLDDIAANVAARKPVDRELRFAHADGHWVWVRARAEVAPSSADGSLHLIGVALDVTEQRNLTSERNRADMLLRAALDSISEAFVLWDADNRLVLCNAKFQALHALPDEAVTPGAHYREVMAAGKRPILIRTPRFGRRLSGEFALAKLETETSLEPTDVPLPPSSANTYEALLEDGRWLNVSERRTRDGGFVSVGTDITTLKRNEETLLMSDRRLRKMVDDLTQSRQALETQAHQLSVLADKYAEAKNRADRAKQKAEDANRAKSEFLANISHELRTPLNAILGFSEIMQSGLFGPLGSGRYMEYCRDINRSGQYLLDVINDILDMAKLEAGKRIIDWDNVDPAALVDDVLRVITPQIDDTAVEVVANVEPLLTLKADRRALKQILLNLMSNALKFTPAGGRIDIGVKRHSDKVDFVISDTGIGIPAEMIAQLGQPFVQVENQYTKHHKGSGLGLAICRSLAAMHDGVLSIEPAVPQGTVVTVTIPMRQAVEASAQPA